MNPKLKLAFMSHSNNKGFSLPLALLIGLVMVVTGITMVTRSQSDQSKVLAQKVKAEGLSVAEVGVTQVQDYLDAIRIMAIYPSECASESDENCWANLEIPSSSRNISTSSTSSTSQTLQDSINQTFADIEACSSDSEQETKRDMTTTKLTNLITLANNAQSGEWTRLEINGTYKYYRLVDYTYTNGNGILTLESRDGKGDLKENTGHTDKTETINRLTVRIPVTEKSLPSVFNMNTAPGLWVKEGATEDGSKTIGSDGEYSGGADFQSHIAMSDCTYNSDEEKAIANFISEDHIEQKEDADGTAITSYKAEFVDQDFPELPSIPTNIRSEQQNLTLNTSGTFPRATDTTTNITTADGQNTAFYVYTVNSIDLNGSDKITITPGKKVIFHVKGDITGNGNGGIEHDCTNVSTDTGKGKGKNKPATTTKIDCKSTDFQIYAHNTSKSSSAEVCLKGNGRLEAFIFAPDYALGKTGNGVFVGSVWGESWGKISNCGSNNGDIAVIQGAEWNLLLQGIERPEADLRIGQITSWNQCSVDISTSDCLPTP